MSHRIITIEREYASGGREIGEMIAERLGIPCYNREILQMASERCNVSMDYLETAEEAAPKSFLYTLMLTSSPTRTIEENLPQSDKVYIIETNIIRELAEKGDCVIVGRCASYILRDLENLPFVCMSRGTSTYTFYQQLFLKYNLAFHVEMEAGTMDQVLAMVQSNLGVGFYPESMAAPALAAGTVFQIHLAEPIPERFVNLIEDTSRPQSVAMKAFKKMLLAPEEE